MNSIQKLKIKAQLRFVAEGARFYHQDPSRRARRPGGSCYYTHPETGNHCFIGRHLDPPMPPDSVLNGKGVTYVFELLPEEVRELGEVFLERCQQLHDFPGYWTDEGLSEPGKAALKDLMSRIRIGDYAS